MAKEGKRILIIEDNNILSNSLREALNDEGIEVVQAFDGETGLKTAKDIKPDLILLDLLLPKLHGLDLLKDLRKDEWGKEAPVIILSVLNESETIGAALEGNVFTYMAKDQYTLDDIVKVAKDELNSTKQD